MGKQVKNPKRMLLYSILAITLGIATILPLSYLTLSADATTQPFFTPYIKRLSVTPNIATTYPGPYMTEVDMDGTVRYYDIPNEADIDVDICFDVTSNGANLKDVDAKIEIYKLHFYSGQGSILNMTISTGICGYVPDSSSPNGITPAITASSGYAHYDNPIAWANHKSYYTFADGTVYDFTKVLGYVELDSPNYQTADWFTARKGHFNHNCMAILSESKGEKTT
jgi:hypothetical protein